MMVASGAVGPASGWLLAGDVGVLDRAAAVHLRVLLTRMHGWHWPHPCRRPLCFPLFASASVCANMHAHESRLRDCLLALLFGKEESVQPAGDP